MGEYYLDPILVEQILRKNEERIKSHQKNRDVAEKWLFIAKGDIEVTKILFDKDYYAAAIYHLQQAFEKLTKGYYILTGRIDPNEAVEHKFVLSRLKKEINEEDIKNIIKLMSSLTEKDFSLGESEKAFEIIERDEDGLRNITEAGINSIINLFRIVEEKLKSPESIMKLKERVHEKRFFRGLKQIILKITHFRVRESEMRKVVEQQKLEEYIDDILISMKLHYLSLITFLHWNTPRYPYDKYSKLNFFDYDKNLGIVQSIPSLTKEFEVINLNIKKKFMYHVTR